MAPTAQQFVDALKREVGTVERPAGSNRTTYAGIAGHANGYAWCHTFLVAMAKSTGLAIPAAVAGTAYTPTGLNAWRAAGRLFPTPQVGDWAYMDFPDEVRRVQHVGVVVEVHANGDVSCVEGNTSPGWQGSQSNGGGVYLRLRPLSVCKGFGRPEYAVDKPKPLAPPHVIVREGSPEDTFVDLYPAILNLPVRRLPRGAVRATDQPLDVAFGVPVWGAGTQLVGRDRHETLRLALDYAAKR